MKPFLSFFIMIGLYKSYIRSIHGELLVKSGVMNEVLFLVSLYRLDCRNLISCSFMV